VFKKGVWYYSGRPLTDHHDLSGSENPNRILQTALGTEYRPQLYINLFNRIRSLSFEEVECCADHACALASCNCEHGTNIKSKNKSSKQIRDSSPSTGDFSDAEESSSSEIQSAF